MLQDSSLPDIVPLQYLHNPERYQARIVRFLLLSLEENLVRRKRRKVEFFVKKHLLMQSEAYNQAMFVCREMKVEERDKLGVRS
jgi:hypothetical protein